MLHPLGLGAAPPVGLQHLPCSPHSHKVLCSISQRYRHRHQCCLSFKPRFATSQPKKGTLERGRVSQPYPRGTAWVCSGPSGGPSAPACWGRPVCSRSSSTGSACLEGDRSVGLIPAPVAVTGAGLGLGSPGTGLRFSGRRSWAEVPPLPATGIGPPGRAASLQPAASRDKPQPLPKPPPSLPSFLPFINRGSGN